MSWNSEPHTENVQTMITVELRIGGPKVYASRVHSAQKAAVQAYKEAFLEHMLSGQVGNFEVNMCSYKLYYGQTDTEVVFGEDE